MDDKQIEKLIKKHGSIRAAAREEGIPKSTFQDMVTRSRNVQLMESKIKKPVKFKHSREGVKRFILSSAQDETKVHEGFLSNLEAYARVQEAELLISGFTYNKGLFEEHRKNYGTFDPRVVPYLTNDRFDIGNNISFCGEMNILPTAVAPLSGLETYTREKWGIFPHAKVQLKSIPTMKASLTKMVMTTGTVTKPNYIQKKDGLKAAFHHVFGAVIVELHPDGSFFCRHLLGDKKDGSFYDLVSFVKDGIVTHGHDALAITWGDIHIEKADQDCMSESFMSEGCLLETLSPEYQFIHDIIDFTSRNHHNIKDPHFLFDQFKNGVEAIEDVVEDAGVFLDIISKTGTKTFVVESNHDLAFMRWLKSADYRTDPVNAKIFLKSQLAVYDAISRQDSRFSILEHLIRDFVKLDNVTFLKEDDSFVIAKEFGGIECAMHGHLGANGAKASSRAFAKMGPKANVGHTHSAEIHDGIYTCGVTGSLDMGFNKGLSSWSHSHIVTYKNGKRAILTMNKGKFFA